MLYKPHQIRSMATAGTFYMVGMDCAALESRGGLLDEPGFVEGVTVKLALNVVFITNAENC